MQNAAFSKLSAVVDELIQSGVAYEDLADALRRVTHDAALRMSSFGDEDSDCQDDEFENMPV